MCVRPPICQPFTLNTTQRNHYALKIIHAIANTVVISEVEFGHIAVKVLLGAVLVDATHTALEHAEIALNRLCMYHWVLEVHILTLGVVHHSMVSDLYVLINAAIVTGCISEQLSLFREIAVDNRANLVAVDLIYNERTSALRISINKRQDFHLVAIGALLRRARLCTDKGFVYFDATAARTENVKRTFTHRFTDTVAKEPCSFVGDFQSAVDLMRRHTLLAGHHQVNRL